MGKKQREYIDEYKMIVGDVYAHKFQDPEEQGRALKRCSLLKPTEEIVYSNHTDARIGYGYVVG